MSALLRTWLVVFLLASTASAELVSYDTNLWAHGAGPQTGWNDGELSGTTMVLGRTLTVTSSLFGTAQFTTDHASRINESFFTGFAFQLQPNTTDDNTGATLSNYMRLDFSFSSPIRLDQYTLTDVDRTDGQWYDVIAAEAFTTATPGAIGTGIDPVYSTNPTTNIGFANFFGLSASGPVGGTGNVQNTPENDISIAFADAVSSFSIYYWNLNTVDNGADTQTIGTRGNQFQISVPEPCAVNLVILGLFATQQRRWKMQA